MWGKKHTGLLLITTLLAGCSTYSLKELRHTTPKGDPFQVSLSKLYMDYAIQEEKNYDWFTSMHFADKGLSLAYGKDVEPEDPTQWDIPSSVLPTMQKAREVLMRSVGEKARHDAPQLAARAYYYYDCWVEQEDDHWKTDEINHCRDGLAETFERLGITDINLIPMVDPEAAPVPAPHVSPKPDIAPQPDAPKSEPVSVPMPVDSDRAHEDEKKPDDTHADNEASPEDSVVLAEKSDKTTVGQRIAQGNDEVPVVASANAGVDTSSYMVFFDDNHTALPDEGKKVVDEITKSLAGTSDYSVVIGANQHVEFAQERAEAVKARLVAGGIKATAITVSVAQVPDFTMDSGEGDSTPIRHRVEIYLNQ